MEISNKAKGLGITALAGLGALELYLNRGKAESTPTPISTIINNENGLTQQIDVLGTIQPTPSYTNLLDTNSNRSYRIHQITDNTGHFLIAEEITPFTKMTIIEQAVANDIKKRKREQYLCQGELTTIINNTFGGVFHIILLNSIANKDGSTIAYTPNGLQQANLNRFRNVEKFASNLERSGKLPKNRRGALRSIGRALRRLQWS